MNSRAKGKRAELEVAKILREAGFPEARRGVQYSGLTGQADVVGLPGVHLEIKHVEALNIYNAMEQSARDSRVGETPWVVHRKNNKPYLCTMLFDDALTLYKLAEVNNDER